MMDPLVSHSNFTPFVFLSKHLHCLPPLWVFEKFSIFILSQLHIKIFLFYPDLSCACLEWEEKFFFPPFIIFFLFFSILKFCHNCFQLCHVPQPVVEENVVGRLRQQVLKEVCDSNVAPTHHATHYQRYNALITGQVSELEQDRWVRQNTGGWDR